MRLRLGLDGTGLSALDTSLQETTSKRLYWRQDIVSSGKLYLADACGACSIGYDVTSARFTLIRIYSRLLLNRAPLSISLIALHICVSASRRTFGFCQHGVPNSRFSRKLQSWHSITCCRCTRKIQNHPAVVNRREAKILQDANSSTTTTILISITIMHAGGIHGSLTNGAMSSSLWSLSSRELSCFFSSRLVEPLLPTPLRSTVMLQQQANKATVSVRHQTQACCYTSA